MTTPQEREQNTLREAIARDSARMQKGEHRRPSLLGLLLYGGTLGLLFVVPIVAGAYLGRWLDTMMTGFSVRWTISLIVLGIVFGIWNVYRYLKEHYDQAE